MESTKGSKTSKSLNEQDGMIGNIVFLFNFNKIGYILMYWLLHYTEFCDSKEL